jgi:hypothetical protein
MEVIIIVIIIFFFFPSSCSGALRYLKRYPCRTSPLACSGLAALGWLRWHLYIIGAHATQLASHASTAGNHFLQQSSC